MPRKGYVNVSWRQEISSETCSEEILKKMPLVKVKLITLTVNGKSRKLIAPTSLLEFLDSLEVNTKFVAVGHNGDVLDKEQFGAVMLEEGDVLEIVRPVGGG